MKVHEIEHLGTFLWILWILDSFKGPTPHVPQPRFLVLLLFYVFLRLILHPFFDQFLIHFGSNLGPKID